MCLCAASAPLSLVSQPLLPGVLAGPPLLQRRLPAVRWMDSRTPSRVEASIFNSMPYRQLGGQLVAAADNAVDPGRRRRHILTPKMPWWRRYYIEVCLPLHLVPVQVVPARNLMLSETELK